MATGGSFWNRSGGRPAGPYSEKAPPALLKSNSERSAAGPKSHADCYAGGGLFWKEGIEPIA
jgi:hypothetical protein